MAQGRLRAKRAELEQALRGTLLEHQACMIAQHLSHLDFLEEQITAFDTQIDVLIQTSGLPPTDGEATAAPGDEASGGEAGAAMEGVRNWAVARELCDAVPGIGPRIAETIIAELGCDTSRFASAAHAASWARLAPGQNESAGKRRTGRIGKGNRIIAQIDSPRMHLHIQVSKDNKERFVLLLPHMLTSQLGMIQYYPDQLLL